MRHFLKYYIPHGRQCSSSDSVRCHFLFFQCSWNFRRPDWLLVIKQIDWRKLYNYNLTRNLWKLLVHRISVIYSSQKSSFFNLKLTSVIWRAFFSLKENHMHTSNLVKFTWFARSLSIQTLFVYYWQFRFYLFFNLTLDRFHFHWFDDFFSFLYSLIILLAKCLKLLFFHKNKMSELEECVNYTFGKENQKFKMTMKNYFHVSNVWLNLLNAKKRMKNQQKVFSQLLGWPFLLSAGWVWAAGLTAEKVSCGWAGHSAHCWAVSWLSSVSTKKCSDLQARQIQINIEILPKTRS